MTNKLGVEHGLGKLIALLVLLVATGGLLFPNLYLDTSQFVLVGWWANDLVTLFLALPLLIISLWQHKSLRWRIVLLGVLYYILYNFFFYLYGAALNVFFLVYVVLFVSAMFALIFGLKNLDVSKLSGYFSPQPKFAKWISGFLMTWAVLLGMAWFVQWLDFMLTGNLPEVMVNVGATTNLIGAADFTLAIPFIALASVWLWRGETFGFVLGLIVSIKGVIYSTVLGVGSLVQHSAGIEGAIDLLPLWVVACLGYLTASIVLFRHVPD